ncbi:hypothetical protein KS872_004486 [Vibrio parahaemolyticus]|nr:hypothetical protein [Vibrio parahaemolyticus]EME0114425.1 hypothetical protein [Vibrio parahaemolyticus]
MVKFSGGVAHYLTRRYTTKLPLIKEMLLSIFIIEKTEINVMNNIINNFFDEVDFNSFANCGVGKDDCVGCLSDNYFEATEINYDCENKRKLYVVRYLPVHVKEVQSALSLISTKRANELLGKRVLNVICLGGGPGTDSAAFNKWLVSQRLFDKKSLTRVNVVRVDRCEEWNEISPRIINHAFPDDLVVKYTKSNHDLTKHNLNTSIKADLVIASYLLSEISLEDIPKVAENIKNNITDKATIVINDRNQEEVRQRIEKLYELLGCEFELDSTQFHCGISIDNAIVENAKPKLLTKSIRYAGEL